MSALSELAKLFLVHPDDVDAAMRSERGYRAAISRRSLFAAGAALAAGSVLVGGPLPLRVFSDDVDTWVAHSWAHLQDYLDDSYDPENVFEHRASDLIRICWDYEDGHISDDHSSVRTLRASRWAEECGPGFLCTTEF